MKLNCLNKFHFDSRFILLNALTLTSALLTLKGVNQYNGWSITVRSLRNTALTYVIGGLIIAP